MKPTVVFLVGPTAVGKSSVALALARKWKTEIISADSMLVYKGMDIGTAKPTPRELKSVRHHLINILAPSRTFSVFEFRKRALKAIESIVSRKKIPLVVGGSGLYVSALLHGLSPQPGRDPVLRKKLEAEARIKGATVLHGRLSELDPRRAAEINPADEKRLVRALEILEITRERPSELRGRRSESLEAQGYRPILIGLTRDRQDLYRAIESRVETMFRKGLLSEVKKLKRVTKPRLSRTARQAVGYRELLASLAGEVSLEDAKTLVKRNTRRLAKRQWTWYRKEPNIHWVAVNGCSPSLVVKAIEKILLGY